MPAFHCGQREIKVDEDGIFQIEFPHLRNNNPYSVELRLQSMDGSYSEIKKDVIIGGILRSPHIYVEMPMSSNNNSRASSEIRTY